MDVLIEWIAVAKTPYRASLVVLTAVHLVILWTTAFFADETLPSYVLETLSNNGASTERRLLAETIRNSPALDQRGQCERKEQEISLYDCLSPIDIQYLVVRVLYVTWCMTGHFVVLEIVTGKFAANIGKNALTIFHALFALLFVFCALAESFFAHQCFAGISELCGFEESGRLTTALKMATLVCPAMAPRIYITTAFLWIFALSHAGLAFYVSKKMKFAE